ncbi:MAG: DUF2069 domain-containing protein [Pseudomonadota bacterium]
MLPVQLSRWCWLALIALQLIWFGWLFPSELFGRGMPLVVMTLPLLIPAWWIWQLKPRALVLGGTILLLHFSVAVAEAWTTPALRIIAWLQIILIVIYFLSMPGLRRARAPIAETVADKGR